MTTEKAEEKWINEGRREERKDIGKYANRKTKGKVREEK